MTKRVITTWVAISLGFLAAAPAWGTIGSVISSFNIPSGSYGYGIYAEYSYLYLSGRLNSNYIYTYTHSGTLIRSRSIDPGNQYGLISGSRTHLGPGYVALLDPPARRLKIFSIAAGGAPVASFTITPMSAWNCFWDGDYYYVNQPDDKGRFLRYSRTGVYEGTWTCAGWPANMTYCFGAEYAKRGNYGSGPYFVAGAGSPSRPYCMTTVPGGSLVATWSLPSPYLLHLSYGDSSNPGVYGAAIWATITSPYGVREIDIDARGASAVLPTSIGKVKAIYR
jgi:hypothetical protein